MFDNSMCDSLLSNLFGDNTSIKDLTEAGACSPAEKTLHSIVAETESNNIVLLHINGGKKVHYDNVRPADISMVDFRKIRVAA